MLPPHPGWVLDEIDSAGRENLDPGHVDRYDGKEDADAGAEVALLQSLGIGHDATVVDLGAGTGQFAIAAAASFTRVVAVDVSPVMLQRLRAKAAGVTNLEIIQAGFLTYEHAGAPAHAVYSRYALHHLPDFWKAVALDRMHGILRAGGILRLSDVVYSFDPSESPARIEEWCATGGDNLEAEWSRAEFEEHIRDEHSTFTWLLEPMIERTGFTIEAAEYSSDGFVAKYVLAKP